MWVWGVNGIVGGMEQEEIWDAEAAREYDTPGEGMFAAGVLGPAVERLAALAGGGRALEFAIGTGRVAIPLAGRGVPVTGIERRTCRCTGRPSGRFSGGVPVFRGGLLTAISRQATMVP